MPSRPSYSCVDVGHRIAVVLLRYAQTQQAIRYGQMKQYMIKCYEVVGRVFSDVAVLGGCLVTGGFLVVVRTGGVVMGVAVVSVVSVVSASFG